MSPTKDFQKRMVTLSLGGTPIPVWDGFYMNMDVATLLAHTRALEAMLKKHEWADDSDCPECGGGNPEVAGRLLGTLSEYGPEHYRGHASNCALARLLEGVEASD